MSTSISKMKLDNIRFDADYIYVADDTGRVLKQSLLWYPALRDASEEERREYSIGFDGIHWRNLDVDISYESFEYDDAIPTPFQEFFLSHKEINIAEFAKRIGINATLMRNYINGFKKPSKDRERQIVEEINKLGREYVSLNLS